jgi:hypothetical protein
MFTNLLTATLLCPKHEFYVLHDGFHLVEKINLSSSTLRDARDIDG